MWKKHKQNNRTQCQKKRGKINKYLEKKYPGNNQTERKGFPGYFFAMPP